MDIREYQRRLAKIKKDYDICKCFTEDCKHIEEQVNKIHELTRKMIGKGK